MSGSYSARTLRMALVAATALTALPAMAREAAPASAPAAAPSLEIQFQNPPQSARPRVWWHWMNGNVTKDGIAKDFDWMQRVGIGGVQNFDANLSTPQIVEKRLVYMTPEWQDAFRFAATEADRRGLELTIAASPGWSETGGPWVKPEDGLKKLVWSEAEIEGGKRFTGKLAAPPMINGPFQSVRKAGGIDSAMTGTKAEERPGFYADVAVLAVPLFAPQPLAQPKVTTQDGAPLNPAALFDADLQSSVEIVRGTAEKPAAIVLTYPAAQTIRSATVFNPGAAVMFLGATVSPRLEFSQDGATWHKIADMPPTTVPTTVSFAPIVARYFRVVFDRGNFGIGGGMSQPVDGADMSALARMGAAAAGTPTITVGDLNLFGDARIDRFEAKAAFEVESDYYKLSQGVPEAAGAAPDQVIDLTSRMKPDGTLDWTPPAGRWRILRMGYSLLGTTNHPAPPEATGLEVDKFDGPAVRRYMEHYIGMYRDAAGKDLLGSKGVQAILTDSIEVGAANWTPRMVAQFKALRGYDPTPWLPALTGAIIGSREQSDKFLYDYRRTLADLMATEHYGTVAQVARENGLRVYGEALESGRPSLGDDMSMRRFADIPMSAMWTHTRAEGPRWSHVADIKGAASVAHIYGQNLVAAESMTSALAPWAHSPASLKRIMDLEFVNGVNRPVVHTSVHQPSDDKVPGLALFIFGQYFNRHEAWAELAKPWVDYMARNSLMLQQGRNVADVGYFYGEEAPLTALYEKAPVTDAPKAYAYDFVSQHALTNAMVNQGDELVTQGGARYRAIYLGGSSRRMTLPTLRRLAALVEGGATVIGKAPEGSPSLNENVADYAALVAKLWPGGDMAQVGKGRVIASSDVEAALARIGVAPDFRFTGGRPASRIPFLHRQLADGDSYFLVNQTAESDSIEARFRVTGKVPELWRAETGKTEAVSYRTENGETIVPLTLASDESVHIVFRKPAVAPAMAIKQLVPVPLAELSGAWNVAFQPGRGAPARAVLPVLVPLNENADAGIKYFSGLATYTKDFAAPRGWKPGQPLWLDLGEAREVAEVLVNGQHAGYAWHAPYRVEIGAQVKRGRNQVTVRVANLWRNRMIGDAQPGAQKITWTAMPTYLANAALQPSGLIGPVTINGQRK